MKKSFKKIAASIMAVSAIAVGAVSMTASAYSPTITKSFGSSAKATLYADSSYAYGTTTCSGKDCTVSVTYHGTTKYGSGYGYAKIVQVAQEQEQAHIIPQVVILPTYLIKCI